MAAGTMTRTRSSGHDLLGIYLNDHLMGATGGTELARRMAGSMRGHEGGPELRRLAAEIAQDRAALLEMMTALRIPVRGYKVCAAWIGEKAGRLKLNGRLACHAEPQHLQLLEAAERRAGQQAAGWRTLRTLADADSRLDAGRLDDLIGRARRQADLLEELRVRAARRIIGPDRLADGS